MAKSTKEKSLALGGAVVGLLMGGSAFGATHTTADQGNEFFKYKQVKGSFELADAHADKKCGEKKCGEKKCGEKKCGEKKCGEKKCGEKKCGDKTKKEHKCGEASCG